MNKYFLKILESDGSDSIVEGVVLPIGQLQMVSGHSPHAVAKALPMASNGHKALGSQVQNQVNELRNHVLFQLIDDLGISLSTREIFLLRKDSDSIKTVLGNHGYEVKIEANEDGTESLKIYGLVREIKLTARVTVEAEEV